MIETATRDPSVELTNGLSGLPEAMSVTLDVERAPRAMPTAVAVTRSLADTLRAARLTTNVGDLVVLRAVRMRPPVPARRVDFLA